jgi:multidrug efflux pump subunit AcrB
MIAPSYWIDPLTGNPYLLTVQYPEGYIRNLADFGSMPLRAVHLKIPTRLDSVIRISHISSPTEVDHYQIRRTVDVYVAPSGEDLSGVYAQVQKIIARTPLPENTTVNVRGSVQAMRESFKSFAVGLILSVVLVYLILVAQFRSFVDPFLILLAVPPGLTGVLLILYLTGTPISVMSLMGMLLMVGISVSDSIRIVEFIRRLRENGSPLESAVALGPRVRLRPVLMTTLATLIGLIPMAAKLGTGSEAYAPLARAVIGGLAVSAAQTIFLVPAFYLILHRRKPSQADPVAPNLPEPSPA